MNAVVENIGKKAVFFCDIHMMYRYEGHANWIQGTRRNLMEIKEKFFTVDNECQKCLDEKQKRFDERGKNE